MNYIECNKRYLQERRLFVFGYHKMLRASKTFFVVISKPSYSNTASQVNELKAKHVDLIRIFW